MERRVIKLLYTYFCVLSIIIILAACTKNDTSMNLQDNRDNINRNNNDAIIENLIIANETITQLVVANLDEKIYGINDISLSMMGNSEFVESITKSNKDYKNNFEDGKDREETIYEEIFKNIYKHDYISNIVYVKEQVFDMLNTPKYQESSFFDEFLASELYKKIIEGKGKPIFVVGLFNDDQIYFLRLVRNIIQPEPNKFAVMIIEIDPNKLFDDIPFLDNPTSIKTALIDNNGQAFFNTGINYNVDNPSVNTDTKVVTEENRKIIMVNAKCNNGWIYILEQEIK